MFNLGKEFINTSVELILIMYLWKNFCLKDDSRKDKNILIIFLGSLITIVLTYIKINFICIYILLIILISFIYKRNILKTFLEFCTFLIIDMILQLTYIFITHIFLGINYTDNFKNNIKIGIVNLIVVFSMCKLLFNKKRINIKNIHSNVIYCFIINYSLYIVISKFIWEYDRNIILRHSIIYMLVLLLAFLLQLYLYFYVTKITEEKKELEIRNMYLPIIDNITEEMKRRQHDFKNYINTINGLIEVSSDEEIRSNLKNYITTLNSSNKDIEDIMYIKNTIIKAIIYNKICEAKEKKIDFSYNVYSNCIENILKDYEISDILNNILNNAFEVVSKKEDSRIVVLNILQEDNKNIIEIKNNGEPINPNEFINIFKRGFSSKPGDNRGYGLYNVKKIVNLNKGKIELFFKEDFTVFKILF